MNLRQKNIQKRRRKILDTALQIVVEEGPEGVKIRELAKRAGFSVTTLYNLFGNKDDILVALLENALDEVSPLLEAKRETDPFSAIQAIMVGPVKFLTDNSRILRPILAMLYYKPERRAAPYAMVLLTGIIDSLSGLVEAAQKEGSLLQTLSPHLLAAEIFYSYRIAMEDWYCLEINDEALSARVKTGVLFLLLSVATDKSREHLQNKLGKIQPQALDHLFQRFPGLKK